MHKCIELFLVIDNCTVFSVQLSITRNSQCELWASFLYSKRYVNLLGLFILLLDFEPPPPSDTRRSSSLREAANANLDEQAYPQCIGGVLSVMHDFNSVSGMWSDSQLKGRGG